MFTENFDLGSQSRCFRHGFTFNYTHTHTTLGLGKDQGENALFPMTHRVRSVVQDICCTIHSPLAAYAGRNMKSALKITFYLPSLSLLLEMIQVVNAVSSPPQLTRQPLPDGSTGSVF